MKKNARKTYTLTSCNGGFQSAVLRETFTSFAAAKRAMKQLMGWDRMYLSPEYCTGETYSVSAYGSLAEMRADEDGQANAPTIVTHFG